MGHLYEFPCLWFSLSSAPWVFTKLMEIPISLLRELFIRIIIYFDDTLLLVTSREELLLARNTLIFPPQNLDFFINIKN